MSEELESQNESSTENESSTNISQNESIEWESLLNSEKQKNQQCEEKFIRLMADYQNLTRKTQSDIQNGINAKVDQVILDILKIYDDFVRARDAFAENKTNTTGLDSILKNMDSLFKKYEVTPIDAIGEIFDPNKHEAISVISDSTLDDNTITKEIRKGYISQNRIIRPTLVEISKKSDD